MVEVRYIEATGEITGWCGDPDQFGNLSRGREGELIEVVDTQIPLIPIEECIFEAKAIKRRTTIEI